MEAQGDVPEGDGPEGDVPPEGDVRELVQHLLSLRDELRSPPSILQEKGNSFFDALFLLYFSQGVKRRIEANESCCGDSRAKV